MEVEEIDITLSQKLFYANNKYNKTMIPITNEDKGSVEPKFPYKHWFEQEIHD